MCPCDALDNECGHACQRATKMMPHKPSAHDRDGCAQCNLGFSFCFIPSFTPILPLSLIAILHRSRGDPVAEGGLSKEESLAVFQREFQKEGKHKASSVATTTVVEVSSADDDTAG